MANKIKVDYNDNNADAILKLAASSKTNLKFRIIKRGNFTLLIRYINVFESCV